jgi:hypothetical protein
VAKDFTELHKRLQKYVDDTVDPSDAIMWFNACNEDISFIAGYAKTLTVPFNRDVPVMDLPSDFIELMELKLKKNSQDDYLRIRPLGLVQPIDLYDPGYPEVDGSAGYEIFGDSIEIRMDNMESGQLLYRYYAYLPDVTDLTNVPALKPRFHDMYALFAATKFFQEYQDELQTKNDYWGEYMAKRQELEVEFNRIKTRSRSKTVYQFRVWS